MLVTIDRPIKLELNPRWKPNNSLSNTLISLQTLILSLIHISYLPIQSIHISITHQSFLSSINITLHPCLRQLFTQTLFILSQLFKKRCSYF
jgi:hypothetical protein